MGYFLFILTGRGNELDPFQIAIRSTIILILALILIRMGKKRFLGKTSAFDIVLSVILGSVLSRSINGSAQLIQTIAAGAVIVLLHWVISYLIVRSEWFADIIIGTPKQLISKGKINYNVLMKSHLREYDILESARLNGNVKGLGQIEDSFLETGGNISIIN